jgi:hypothetical protein
MRVAMAILLASRAAAILAAAGLAIAILLAAAP